MRTVVGLVAAAVLVSLAWLLLWRAADAPVGVAAPPTVDSPAGSEPAAVASPPPVDRQAVPPGESNVPAPDRAAPTAALWLQLRVRDSLGASAAGVPVRASLGAIEPGRTEVRPTDRDGLARFPLPAAAAGRLPQSIDVALELATFQPVRAAVPAAAIERGEVHELVLPPCGALAVTLLQLDGSPFTGTTGRLELRPLALAESLDDAAHRTGVFTDPQHGRAEFAYVPLHSAFALIPHAVGLHASFAPQRVVGPTAAGQRVEIALREDATRACAVVRLVDAARRALPRAEVDLELHETVRLGASTGMTSTSLAETTDADGELRLWFAAGGTDVRSRRIVFTLRARPEARGTLNLDEPLPAGITRLGDVVIDEVRSVAVAGRVLDDNDGPVAGARIDLGRISRLPGGGQTIAGIDAGATTDAHGAFAVALDAPADTEFRVSAVLAGYVLDEALEAPFGATDLVLRLRRAGSITGSLAVEPSDLGLIAVAVRRDGDRRSEAATVDPRSGAFAVRGLKPDSYAVEFTASGRSRPWLRVAGVVVEAGKPTADPRLQDVGLPNGTYRVRVIVQDSAGRPLADAIVRAEEPGEPATRVRMRRHGSDGVSLLVTPGTPLLAGAPGFRSQTLIASAAEHTVRLQPGIPLRVGVRGDDAASRRDVTVAVIASPANEQRVAYLLEGEGHTTAGSVSGLDGLLVGRVELTPGSEAATLILPSPGAWRVTLEAMAASGAMRISTPIRDASRVVQVDAAGGTVTLGFTAAAIDAALRK